MTEESQTKLDAHILKSDEHYVELTAKFKQLAEGLEKLNVSLDNKVSWKEFTWILGILITILMAMFGWISLQIIDLQRTTNATNQSVSMIQGKLEPYNIEFNK